MILCTSCRHASPSGSTYCQDCSRSLNCRVCDKGHRNGTGARACTACGSLNLSEPARGVRLGWLALALSTAAAVFAWKALLAYAGVLLPALGRGGLEATAFLLNTSACCLVSFINSAFAWLIVLWLFGHLLGLLPGKGGSIGAWLRGLPLLLARTISRRLPGAGRMLVRGFARLFWPRAGRPAGGGSQDGGGKGGSH